MQNKRVLLLFNCILICVMSCENFGEAELIPFGSYLWQAPPKYDDSGATKSLNVAAVSFYIVASNLVIFIGAKNPGTIMAVYGKSICASHAKI
jgi:hypothetical protein